jgi:hypothetical protein
MTFMRVSLGRSSSARAASPPDGRDRPTGR